MSKTRRAKESSDRGEQLPETAPVAARRRGRRLLITCLAGAFCIACAVGVRMMLPRDQRPVVKTVADTTPATEPEIAALLQEADKRIGALAALDPDNVQVWNLLAELHKRFGAVADARIYWNHALKLEPGFFKARDALGIIALEGGDLPEAERQFLMARVMDPTSSAVAIQLGEVLINQGKISDAISVLEADRARHPQSVATLALLGQSYVKEKKYELARDCLEPLIKLAPDYTNGFYTLSQAYMKLGEPDKARDCLKRFQELKARDEASHRGGLKSHNDTLKVRQTVSQLLVDVATELIALGEIAGGEQTVSRALELDRDNLGAYQLLGWLYHRQSRPHEAIGMLAEAVNRGKNDLQNQMRVGRLYASMGLFEEAERAFQRASELTPHQAGGYAALAKLYIDADRKLPEAVQLARKATEQQPSADFYELLGIALERTGDADAARRALEQADRYRRAAPAVPWTKP